MPFNEEEIEIRLLIFLYCYSAVESGYEMQDFEVLGASLEQVN
jgi:hypothetical protein